MKIWHFFEEATFPLTYVVQDETARAAVVIDPVLDCTPTSGRTSLRRHVH